MNYIPDRKEEDTQVNYTDWCVTSGVIEITVKFRGGLYDGEIRTIRIMPDDDIINERIEQEIPNIL